MSLRLIIIAWIATLAAGVALAMGCGGPQIQSEEDTLGVARIFDGPSAYGQATGGEHYRSVFSFGGSIEKSYQSSASGNYKVR